jgi:Ni/Co efflux regulator RcnB
MSVKSTNEYISSAMELFQAPVRLVWINWKDTKMKNHLLLGVALSLLLPATAQAQEDPQRQGGGRPDQRQRQGSQGQGQRPNGQGQRPQGQQGQEQRQGPQGQGQRQQVQQPQGQRQRWQRPQSGIVASPTQPNRQSGRQSGAQVQQQRQNWVRPAAPVQQGQAYRINQGRPGGFQRLRANPFSYPHGYSYRRWSVGLLLPSIFLSSGYYYNDYAYFGVGAPSRGYHWVRYGSDLLLVNRRTGRIARIIYDAFY